MGANELSALLWRERELLELLTFKLEEEQLLLTAGRTRWIDHATREVEQVLDRLRSAGLDRSVEVSSVAQEWGTDEEAPLREIIAAAPAGPWGEIFTAHLAAMTELTARIAQLRDENERFLRAAARATQETLATTTTDAGAAAGAIYDATGSTAATTAGRRVGTTGPASSGHLFDGRL
ncbi:MULTISPECIES: flagellar protein FlgN [unclassified Frigoribacterium]|jgi:flagellar biosynthesis/type III secretory pathway chaperone|uniref:flagellar protein FlgN n=1 Tax=unclassified Frigoribacterium TaxID=2627005 RepID=UPI0009EA1C7F|nr:MULTISPECIES: flagellar protein FlgN [unclassified Frigoribacterium]